MSKRKRTRKSFKYTKKTTKTIKKVFKTLELEKNKFNGFELALMFIMALVFGILIGEIAFNNNSITNLSINESSEVKEIEKVYNTIKKEYIEDISSDKLKEAAIEGMMSLLKDNYSVYYNKENSEDFKETLEGSFYGLGVEIYQNSKKEIIINKVYDHTPAAKAGLKKGDKYLKINGKDVTNKNIDELSKLIKGATSKALTITVEREGKALSYKINTDKVDIPSVESKIIEKSNKKIGYIYISTFASNTPTQFDKALNKIKKEKTNKLIIDLRSNPGGDLESVIAIASNFLSKKDVVVNIVTNKVSEPRYSIKDGNKNYEIAVLIDHYSASGSEVLASALSENCNATLIGETTYGKGSVQKIKTLSSGTIMKYTAQTWKTSKGKSIDKIGIKPTIKVTLNEKYYKTLDEKDDNQYQKAINVLLKK